MASRSTPPYKGPDRRSGGGLSPDDVQELRAGVVSLAARVTDLSSALSTVNKIQQQVAANERKAQEVAVTTAQIQEDLIPRAEHEKRWKKEQADLIRTRLSIRRQTYIIGTAFFLLSLVALAVVAALVFHDLNGQAKQRHDQNVARCIQGNEFRQGDLSLWQEVIGLSRNPNQTPAEQKTTQQFEEFLKKHDAQVDCSKA